MTRFIIHIGPHKTGSTYLQNHLRDNRAALVGRGIYYPREWATPEIDWCHAELPRLLQQGSFGPVERTFADLKAAGWPTTGAGPVVTSPLVEGAPPVGTASPQRGQGTRRPDPVGTGTIALQNGQTICVMWSS